MGGTEKSAMKSLFSGSKKWSNTAIPNEPEYIRSQSSLYFDPQVVDLFMRLTENGE